MISNQRVRQISAEKAGEMWIFRYRVGQEMDLLEVLGDMAENKDNLFDADGARVVSFMVGHMACSDAE